jgi:WD40 repeat protein
MGCSLVLDAEAVYLADEWDGTIRRLPRAGGAGAVLAERQGMPVSLAVDDRHAFWTTAATERLRRAPKSGGAFGGLAADVTVPWKIALDETHVFFTRHHVAAGEDDAMIVRVPKEGGAAAVLARARPNQRSTAIALDSDHVYFALDDRMSGHGAVLRVPKAGGEVQTLASELMEPERLAVDDAFVYFTTGGRAQDGEVVRVPKAGGASVPLYKAGGDKAGGASPIALALDAASVFFTDSHAAIWRVPKAGGVAQKLAALPDGGSTALELAIDESALWVCGHEGLWKVSWAPFSGSPDLLPTFGTAARPLAFDGKGHLVGADSVGHARAYDVTNGRTGPELGRGRQVRNLAVGAAGRALLLADENGTIERWDLASGKLDWQDAGERFSVGDPSSFAVSPDGTLLLYRRALQPMRLLSVESGKEIASFKGRFENFFAVAIAPYNTFWLTGTEHVRSPAPPPRPDDEPPLRMWDLKTGKLVAAFRGEPESILAIAITGGGAKAVTAGEEGLLRVWDIASRSAVATMTARGPLTGLALSRSGERALTISRAEGACLWDLAAKKRLACSAPRPRTDGPLFQAPRIVFSPSEREAWWSSSNGYVRWKLPEGS